MAQTNGVMFEHYEFLQVGASEPHQNQVKT